MFKVSYSERKGIFVASAIAVLVMFAYFILTFIYSPYGNQISRVSIGNKTFLVENVSSQQKLTKGLGERKSMCQNCGMLFNFSQPEKYAFWMKGMLFSLDLIWIKDNAIVHIEKNVQPDFGKIMTPPVAADSVLELNAGSIDAIGIRIGDKINRL